MIEASLAEILDPTFVRDVLSALNNAIGAPDSSPPSKGIVLLGYDGSQVRRVKVTSDGVLTIPFASKFKEFKDQALGAGEWLNVLQYTGAGQVEEFFVLSPNTDFKVQITVDGAVVLEKTYDELREVQQNSRDISAFAELDENGDPTGYYVASIRNIPHTVSIQVKVQNTGATPTTLPNIFVKYKTLGE